VSQENVEIVRQITAAFLRGDWDAVSASSSPEVEWEEMPSLGPDASSYHGIGEVREALQSWMGMWRDYEIEVHDYVDAGGDVVVLARETGRGRTSGVSAVRELGDVFTLRDGKVVRVRLYGSWHEALEAAGLRE
jgi:ketosteroid isomerase-like protein